MRWGAIIAGTAVALGLWILLQTLGMGLGLAAVDTDNAGSLKAVGIGTGIWSIIAPLIALFLGAYVAGRFAGARESAVGGMHGAVVWALTTVLGLWAMLSVVSAVASGAARVGGAAAHVTGTVISGAATAGGKGAGGAMNALGIDANDLLAPVNQRLQQQGKPPVTADQLQDALRGIAQRGLHEGKLDRNVVVEEIARDTSLSRADSEDVANQIEARYHQVAGQAEQGVQQVGEKATSAALQAADKTGKALLVGGVMMLLSLASAFAGGMLGVRSLVRRMRRDEASREEMLTRTTIVPPPPEP